MFSLGQQSSGQQTPSRSGRRFFWDCGMPVPGSLDQKRLRDPRAMQRIASETGAVVAGTLYGDSLTGVNITGGFASMNLRF
jgi:hypothetical protein